VPTSRKAAPRSWKSVRRVSLAGNRALGHDWSSDPSYEVWVNLRICAIVRPMDRDTAINLLKAHEAELRRLGVQHLYLFGSTARGEARTDSDVDLFFDHEWGKLSLFDVMEIQEVTARILGCKTDAMTRGSLHPVLRDRIEMSALPVF
jgi:predicted nucleotidyltransferase